MTLKRRSPDNTAVQLLLVIGVVLAGGGVAFGQTTADWVVAIGNIGKLQYASDSLGNRIPDFSNCGFAGADRPIPVAPVRITVTPTVAAADDGQRIQAAIDYVASLPVGEDGFRGTVLLKPGEFHVAGQLHVTHSGVVLRGSGAGDGGTTLRARGLDRRTLIRIHGVNDRVLSGATREVIDNYVPVGSRSVRVNSTEGLLVGDSVLIVRPSRQEWIQHIGADALGVAWRAGSRDVCWERVVTNIRDDTIEFDAPITTAIEQRFGGATIRSLHWPGRIRNVGIEDLALISDFDPARPLDEDHAWGGVSMQNVMDAWVRRIQFKHFAGGAVSLWENTKCVTVEDCVSLEPVSELGGYRRHSFFTQGQLGLFLRCWSEQGRHDFSVGHCAPGPNAFVNCYAHQALGSSGPLESWASGVLYDNVRIDGGELGLQNRHASPPNVGWSAANCVLWQCQASTIRCSKPPAANNWAIGLWAVTAGDGVIQQVSSFVRPLSLYRAQLAERMGAVAARRVDPLLLNPVGATNPTLEQAATFSAQSSEPARQLIDIIRENQQVGASVSNATTDAPLIDELRPDLAAGGHPDAGHAARVKRLSLQNGWLVVDGLLKTGSHLTPTWWRGTMLSANAPGFGPAITRFAPGRVGLGFTDDLDQVASSMVSNDIASYDHHYGLWYDRRRDDHLMVRRADGEVAPPFYEQPFARTGMGTAWDGLSRYDLTKFNPWYWNRLREFANCCDQNGLVLFHQNYFQHNVLEAGAHWADSPWRPANNVNDSGLPEPPPYIGDKRIFLAHLFYDISDPRRRELHRNYIRQCLNSFASAANVIQMTSAEYTGPLAFTQFWLDTIIEWQLETGRDVLVGLSCTKDVQDAILADPRRNKYIDVIDIRYWTYTSEQTLYAPEGGRNLSPRQHLRQQKPAATSFSSIVRAVREYRTKYPDKAVTYYADLHCRSAREGWAVLMGGGSLPNLPRLHPELAVAIPAMQPSDELDLASGQWCLARNTEEYLIYSDGRDAATEFTAPDDNSTFRLTEIEPESGKVTAERNVIGGQSIALPRRGVVTWLRR